jgi:hypothetical protein
MMYFYNPRKTLAACGRIASRVERPLSRLTLFASAAARSAFISCA